MRFKVFYFTISLLYLVNAHSHSHQHSHSHSHEHSHQHQHQHSHKHQPSPQHSHPPKQLSESSLQQFLTSLNTQAYQWIGIPSSTLTHSFSYCNFHQHSPNLSQLLSHLQSISQNFTLSTLQHLNTSLRSTHHPSPLSTFLLCLSSFSHTSVPFLTSKRKYSTIKTYITTYPQYSQKIFSPHYTPQHKGQSLGKWVKGFMQYYYVHFVSQSQTLSTILFRSLSTKVPLLQNRDFSYCITLDTAGTISQSLQNLDINNIFLKVPAAWNALKFMSLKEKCRTEENGRILKELRERIKGIDLFRVMYHGYQPYVGVATEKYGISKVRMLAREFAGVINRAEEVERQIRMKDQEEERMREKEKMEKQGKGKKEGGEL